MKKNKQIFNDLETTEPLQVLTDKLYKINKKKSIWRMVGRIAFCIMGFCVGFCFFPIFTGGWLLRHTILAIVGATAIIPSILSIVKSDKYEKDSMNLQREINKVESKELDIFHEYHAEQSKAVELENRAKVEDNKHTETTIEDSDDKTTTLD